MFSFLINIFCFSTLQHNRFVIVFTRFIFLLLLSKVSVGIMRGPRQTSARHHFMTVVRRDNHDQMNHSSLVFYFGIRTVTCCCVTVFMCFFSWCVSCKRCWDILLFWPRFSLLMPALSTRTFFKLYSMVGSVSETKNKTKKVIK